METKKKTHRCACGTQLTVNTRGDGAVVVHCPICGKKIPYSFTSSTDVIVYARRRGWVG